MFDLPKGWELKTIGVVTEPPQYGYTTKASESGSIKFLRTTDISSKTLNWVNVPYCTEAPEDISKCQLKTGDIVISRTGTIGISTLIENEPPETVFASYLIRFRPEINPKYFYYFLQSPLYWTYVNNQKSGIAVQNLNATKIKSFPVPVAPRKVQQEIVNKLDLIFIEIDNGINELKFAQSRLESYRQSILNAAIRGKLVPQDPSDEPASVLLEKIKAEKEALIKLGKLKREKSLPLINLSGIPFGLPQGWEWVRLGILTDMTAGKSFKESEYSDMGVKLLQIANVSFGYTKWEQVVYLPQSYRTMYPELDLKENDVLLALNRPILNGKIKVTKLSLEDLPTILYQRVGCFRSYSDNILHNNFLFYYLQSSLFIEQIQGKLKGIDQPFLNKNIVMNALIPLPNIHMQKRIANYIEAQLNHLQKDFIDIRKSLESAKLLKSAILKIAFQGKLI